MRKYLRWCSLPAIAAIGFVLASCGEESPTAIQEANTPTVTETASTPSFVLVNGQDLTCMGDEAADTLSDGTTFVQGMGANEPYDLNCTANDVVIALAFVDNCVGCTGRIENPDPDPAAPDSIFTCVEGDTLTITGSVSMKSNAQQTRGDIGWWVASDGGDGISGSCTHFWFDTDGSPDGLDDLDGDACGDIGSKDFFASVPLEHPDNTFTIVCQDTNQDNNADAGACTGWKVPGDDLTCPGDQFPGGGETDEDFTKGTLPANKAKCRCDPLDFPIALQRQATVTIVKDLIPSDDPGLFDLQILEYDSATVADSAHKIGDGGSASATILWTTLDEGTANKAYVEETNAYLGTNSGSNAFQFYDTSYECKDDGGSGSVVASGSGPGTGGILLDDLSNGDDIVCTVTNTRIPVPAVSVSKDTVPTFTRKWTWDIDKQAFDQLDAELTTDTTLNLQVDEIFSVGYKVTVTPTSKDTLWNITGTITVSVSDTSGAAALDPFGPYSGTFSVVDTLANNGTKVAATVDCDLVTEGDQTSF
ncbi:MAG: hypothetical protein RRA92_10985, partial [Gemmatimonadota bacterium]|nr:hypothetical protein [Gemmatimonadota bacterium]